VVLGKTGRNFAAGMSGGIAYVFDEDGDFARRCNQEMVDLEWGLDRLEDMVEMTAVQNLIWQHAMYTGSRRAWKIVRNWNEMQSQFVKVIPKDYRRMLQSLAEKRELVNSKQ
jgi:glutamate synthase (ferredoxin)